MGSQNQEMVDNVHLNRRGLKGDGIAYFFKHQIPQEQHRTISSVSTRVQSEHSPSVSSEPALPSVKETVCTDVNIHELLKLKPATKLYDNVYANLDVQTSCRNHFFRSFGSRYALSPSPPGTRVYYNPPHKYLSKIW